MKSKKMISTLLALTIATSFTLTACGSKESKTDDKKTNNAATDKKDGKKEMDKEQYYNSTCAEPETLDPGKKPVDTNWVPQGYIYEGLTNYEAKEDGTGEIKPGVAETWETSTDGKTYTFHLRKDAKWADGQPLTAKDFEYTFKRLYDPKVGSDANYVFTNLIKNASKCAAEKNPLPFDQLGVKAVDDYTLQIELEQPCGYFMQLTYFASSKPVRKDVVERLGDQYGSDADKVMGNGAYKLKTWEHKNQMVFEKNENYWDKDKINVPKLTWKIIANANTQFQMFDKGQLDATTCSNGEWMAKFKADKRFTYIGTKGLNISYFGINNAPKYKAKGKEILNPMSNPNIRKAFSISIDRDEYASAIKHDTVVPWYTEVADGIQVGALDYRKEAGEEPIKKLIAENKDAKELLKKGMAELNLGSDPSKLTISMITRGIDEATKKESEWFADQWKKKLGVNVTIEALEYGTMYSRMKSGEYQLSSAGWFADYNDPSTFLDNFHSKTGYEALRFKYVNTKYDALVDKARVSRDDKERAKLYTEAENILLYEDSAFIPFSCDKSSTFRAKYVKDYFNTQYGFNPHKGFYIQGRK